MFPNSDSPPAKNRRLNLDSRKQFSLPPTIGDHASCFLCLSVAFYLLLSLIQKNTIRRAKKLHIFQDHFSRIVDDCLLEIFALFDGQ